MPRELKTKKTSASVAQFLAAIPEAAVRDDSRTVAKLMQRATGAPARMWGPSIVGFGEREYQGATGSVK